MGDGEHYKIREIAFQGVEMFSVWLMFPQVYMAMKLLKWKIMISTL